MFFIEEKFVFPITKGIKRGKPVKRNPKGRRLLVKKGEKDVDFINKFVVPSSFHHDATVPHEFAQE